MRAVDRFSESVLARRVEAALTAGVLNKPADGLNRAARLFSRMQTGNVQAYLLYGLAGLALVLWWGVFHA